MSERFSDEVLQRVYQAASIAASEAHAEFATPEDTMARAIAAMRAVLEAYMREIESTVRQHGAARNE
jgi:hypothetical protein